MADYEVFANNAQDMRTALNTLSMSKASGFRSRIRFAVDYYGTKYTWDGVTTTPNVFGGRDRVMVAQPGVYANVRWVAASVLSNPFPPAGLTFPAGVTFNPLPANSPRKFS